MQDKKHHSSMEEIWKDINGYNGIYSVSNNGRIRANASVRMCGRHKTAKKKEKILKPKNHIRYFGATLCKDGGKKQVLIHRIVATAFLPNPLNLPQVNHINSDSLDNRVENLEWCTALENQRHSISKGRKKSGGEHGQAKILLDLKTGVFYECIKDAAFAYGVSRTHITNMLTGHRVNRTNLIYV